MGGRYYNGDSFSDYSSKCYIREQEASDEEVILVTETATRKGVIIFNESVYTLYVKFGTGVSSESFTVKLFPGATYEMSQTSLYTGNIYGVWDAADGLAHITQLI